MTEAPSDDRATMLVAKPAVIGSREKGETAACVQDTCKNRREQKKWDVYRVASSTYFF
jgi:hypothetical protein